MKHNKTPEANLEPKRKVYFQLGFAVALSVVLAAFEWTDYSYQEYAPLSYAGDPIMEEEVIPFNRVEKPTPPKANTKTNVFKIVPVIPVIGDPGPEPDPHQLDFEKIFDFEPTVETVTDEGGESLPLMRAEIMPFYDQCKNVLNRQEQHECTQQEIVRYVQSRVKYPRLCVEAGIQGTVYISFVVDKSGQVRDVKVERGLHKQIDKNCIDVVNTIPEMNPASQQGKNVAVYYNIPVKFTLN